MIEGGVEWWDAVATHPEVAPHIFMGLEPFSLAPLLTPPNVALRSENGGCIFVIRDPLGLTAEMHTMFRPEGWGREVATAGRRFMAEMFGRVSLILTHEQEGNWRSRPPRSHGWVAAGEFMEVGLPRRLRLWVLTRDAWMKSSVGRKSCL